MGKKLSGVTLILCLALAAAGQTGTLPRGKYIFLIADCGGCHSVHDPTRLGSPVLPGSDGKGQVFPDTMGLPGKVVAPNITPDKQTGIGNWTAAEKIRAIRQGIGRDGKTLFPFMPFPLYRKMSDTDVKALVAYLNSLPPVSSTLPRTQPPPGMTFPAPPPVGSVPEPDRKNRLQYGEYLTTIGGCAECHTKSDQGRPISGMLLAGGEPFRFPGLTVLSANITADPETGIGTWTEQQFVNRFAIYRQYAENDAPKVGPDAFTLMPWLSLSQLPREDLAAIYTYLKTVPPVRNKVVTHPAAAQ